MVSVRLLREIVLLIERDEDSKTEPFKGLLKECAEELTYLRHARDEGKRLRHAVRWILDNHGTAADLNEAVRMFDSATKEAGR